MGTQEYGGRVALGRDRDATTTTSKRASSVAAPGPSSTTRPSGWPSSTSIADHLRRARPRRRRSARIRRRGTVGGRDGVAEGCRRGGSVGGSGGAACRRSFFPVRSSNFERRRTETTKLFRTKRNTHSGRTQTRKWVWTVDMGWIWMGWIFSGPTKIDHENN